MHVILKGNQEYVVVHAAGKALAALFNSQAKRGNWSWWRWCSIGAPKVTRDQQVDLMRLFQEDNVWEAIKGLNREGFAPCPDGFPGFIFSKFSKIIKTGCGHAGRILKKLWHGEN